MSLDLTLASQRLISVSTVSDTGNLEALPLLYDLMQGMGLTVTLIPASSGGSEHATMVARMGPETGGGLMLASHIDTADPGEWDRWTICEGDPFNPVVKDGRLYGLGAAGGKIDWLAKVEAVRRLDALALKKPVYIVATWGEQMGLLGARQLVENGAVLPEFACVGEPTGLTVVNASKGCVAIRFRLRDKRMREPAAGKALYRITCQGTPAHSATPVMGDSAILRALALLTGADGRVVNGCDIVSFHGGDAFNRVPDRCEIDVMGVPASIEAGCVGKISVNQITRVVSGVRINRMVEAMGTLHTSLMLLASSLEPQQDPSFDPPGVVLNLGTARSYSDHLDFSLDLRLLPGHDYRDIMEWMQRAIGQLADRFPNIEIDGGLAMRADPMFTPPDSRLVQTALQASVEAGLGDRLATVSSATEGGVYNHAGIQTVLFGPGPISGSVLHPDEYVEIESVGRAVGFYEALVRRLCL
ncbi:MAG: M20/M25/M40 family metallo-hydrolase [Myxococcota bacterium]|jgi:acetylornithine deacetylase/succinyl-diaminopimelate desuccinylase-like protein